MFELSLFFSLNKYKKRISHFYCNNSLLFLSSIISPLVYSNLKSSSPLQQVRMLVKVRKTTTALATAAGYKATTNNPCLPLQLPF